MAEPFDSAVTQKTVETILEEQYFPKLLDVAHMKGSTTNKLIAPMAYGVVGDGVTIKAKRYGGDHVRISNDALDDFDTATPFDVQEYKLRWDERTPSNNDFTHISATGRVSVYQFDGADSEGAITDIVEEINGDITGDYNWTMATLARIPRTGLIGYINGTPKQNDRAMYADCSSTPTTTMRVLVDGTSAALFRRGKFYDIYNGSNTLRIGNVRCVDVKPEETTSGSQASVGFEVVSSGSKQSTNLTGFTNASVSDNDTIYIAGAKDVSMYSVEAWYANPGASEAFIGGRNRSQAAYHWMVPTLLRSGSASVKIAKSHFDEAGDALSFITDTEDYTFVAVANPRLITALKEQYDAAAFINFPTGDDRSKRFANLGSTGVNIQHPTLGTIKLVGDPFMLPDHVDLMSMDSWKRAYRGSRGLRFLRDGGSMWYRMQGATSGGGKSMFYGLDAYANHADICLDPKANVRISNVAV
jgi:hypothetical protein